MIGIFVGIVFFVGFTLGVLVGRVRAEQDAAQKDEADNKGDDYA